MKLLSASIAVVAAFFLFHGRLLAAPCVTSALDDYLGLGAAGCSVNEVSFFNFQLPALLGDASPIASDAIVVSPLATAGNPGLAFTVNAPLTANAGELLEILIGFEASAAAGSSIQGNSLQLVGQTAVLPDGAITVVEDKCLGGMFATPLSDCNGTPAVLIVFDLGNARDTSDSLAFSPVAALAVVADLAVDGGTAGSAILPAAGGANLRFATVAQVPEPSAGSLLAACALAFGLTALRRRPSRPPA